MRSITPLLVLAVLAVAQASPAATAGRSPPATLGQSNLNYMYGNNVSVALSSHPQAQSVAVWVEDDYNTYAVTLTHDAGWGAPLVMSAGAAQYAAVWGTGVTLAAGANQRASTVWLSVAGTNGQVRILASSHQP